MTRSIARPLCDSRATCNNDGFTRQPVGQSINKWRCKTTYSFHFHHFRRHMCFRDQQFSSYVANEWACLFVSDCVWTLCAALPCEAALRITSHPSICPFVRPSVCPAQIVNSKTENYIMFKLTEVTTQDDDASQGKIIMEQTCRKNTHVTIGTTVLKQDRISYRHHGPYLLVVQKCTPHVIFAGAWRGGVSSPPLP